MFKVGIVGCGGIAQVHAASVAALSDVRLAACADIRAERAQAMAAEYGLNAYSSLEDMLSAEALDAVHICTPHFLHAPMALEAAKRGAAVLTEKPPLMARDQWPMLEEAAQRVPLGVCFQNRYNENVREAERIIASGEMGGIIGGRAFVTWRREKAYYADSGWRGAWATEGGGALINQSIHTLDLLIKLMGRVDSVECAMANRHLKDVIQVEDTVEAYLRLGGKPALFYASTGYAADAPVLIEIALEAGSLRLEGERLLILREGEAREIPLRKMPAPGKAYWGSGHMACIADFYDCLRTGRPFRNDLDSVRETMGAVLTMYDQARA